LYAFLDLIPDLGLVGRRRSDGRQNPTPMIRWLIGLAAFPLFGVVAAATFRLFVPLEFGFREAAPLFSVGFALVAVAWMITVSQCRRRRERRAAEMNALALAEGEPFEIAPVGSSTAGRYYRCLVLTAVSTVGGLAILYGTYAVNALCDRSAGREQKVQISRFKVQEHHGIFRTHTIEYLVPWSPRTCRLCTSPERIAELERAGAGMGIAEIRRGYLGWPWVDSIRPDAGAPRK
jgi:hypothetical protein